MHDELHQLEARRAELIKRLEAIRKDLRGGLEKDYEEQAIQLENLEVLQEISRVAEKEIAEIDQKIARLHAESPNKPE